MNGAVIAALVSAGVVVAIAIVGASWRLASHIDNKHQVVIGVLTAIQVANQKKETQIAEVILPKLQEHTDRLADHDERIRAVETADKLADWTQALLDIIQQRSPAEKARHARAGGD